MENLEFSRLFSVGLELDATVLRLEYFEPDQGGTRLVHRFLLPTSLGLRVGQVLRREDGYLHEQSFRTQIVNWDGIPSRVTHDASVWLRDQLSMTHKPFNDDLSAMLASTLVNLERLVV